MRELVYYVAVSLDGRICGPDGSWDMFPVEGDHLPALAAEYTDALPSHVQQAIGLTADTTRFDTVIMGWHTYTPALDEGIVSPYAHLRQYVASRRDRLVGDAVTLTDDPLRTVQALKRENDGSGIYLAGGGRLAASLLGEIDRLVFKVNPIVLGAGRPVFAGEAVDTTSFRPVGRREFASGVVLAEYERAR